MDCPVQALATSCPAGWRLRGLPRLTRRVRSVSGARSLEWIYITARCGALFSRQWLPFIANLLSQHMAACQVLI